MGADRQHPQASDFKTRPARRAAPKLARSLGPHVARLAKASGAMDPRLASEWSEIAGPELAAMTRPLRIIARGRVQALEVSVRNGSAAMKLQYAQETILQRVRHRLGLTRLSKIVIREGAHKRTWSSQRMAPAAQATPEPRSEGPKSESLKAALESMRRAVKGD